MRNRTARPRDGRGGAELGTKPKRRRRWWRWIAGIVLGLVMVVIAAAAIVVNLTPSPAPLALPRGAAAPSGPLDGSWQIGRGSVAGFRVRETVIGFSNDVTGRTADVTGTATVAGGQVSHASFQIGLGSIAVNGKTRQPQLVASLDVTAHPDATVTLTRPVPLGAAFSSGAVITRTAAAALTLNGITRPVTMTLTARRDGTSIDTAGSIPVAFSEFRIKEPGGYGFLGSLASAGTAEFLLVLRP